MREKWKYKENRKIRENTRKIEKWEKYDDKRKIWEKMKNKRKIQQRGYKKCWFFHTQLAFVWKPGHVPFGGVKQIQKPWKSPALLRSYIPQGFRTGNGIANSPFFTQTNAICSVVWGPENFTPCFLRNYIMLSQFPPLRHLVFPKFLSWTFLTFSLFSFSLYHRIHIILYNVFKNWE